NQENDHQRRVMGAPAGLVVGHRRLRGDGGWLAGGGIGVFHQGVLGVLSRRDRFFPAGRGPPACPAVKIPSAWLAMLGRALGGSVKSAKEAGGLLSGVPQQQAQSSYSYSCSYSYSSGDSIFIQKSKSRSRSKSRSGKTGPTGDQDVFITSFSYPPALAFGTLSSVTKSCFAIL